MVTRPCDFKLIICQYETTLIYMYWREEKSSGGTVCRSRVSGGRNLSWKLLEMGRRKYDESKSYKEG